MPTIRPTDKSKPKKRLKSGRPLGAAEPRLPRTPGGKGPSKDRDVALSIGEVVRNTPILVQLLWVYYVLPIVFGVNIAALVALIIGQLTAGLKREADFASERERRTHALYEMARKLAGALQTEQVDAIVRDMAKYVYDNAEKLARMAVDETGIGNYEDKVLKKKGKARVIWNNLKGKKSRGIIGEDAENNLVYVDAPVDEVLGRRRNDAMIAFAAALPGSFYLYQGEELGLPEVLDIPADRREDPLFIRTNGAEIGRDVPAQRFAGQPQPVQRQRNGRRSVITDEQDRRLTVRIEGHHRRRLEIAVLLAQQLFLASVL